MKRILFAAAVVIIAFMAITSLNREPIQPEPVTLPVCGDGECTEDCWSCPQDCACGPSEYCHEDQRRCITPVCGNRACEPFESAAGCCEDCTCMLPGQECTADGCAYPPPSMTDEQAEQAVRAFISDTGMTIQAVQDIVDTSVDGVPAKQVLAIVDGRQMTFTVKEDGEVIFIPSA